MIKKCLCGQVPKFTYHTDEKGKRKVQVFCRSCHIHGYPKNSDPEAAKSWNEVNKMLGKDYARAIGFHAQD